MTRIDFREITTIDAAGEGEVVVRAPPAHSFGRMGLAELVVQQGLGVLTIGPGPTKVIVVNCALGQPSFDEMLTAWMVERLLPGEALPPACAVLAKYAAILVQGKSPTALPPADTLEGVFLAIRFRAGDRLTEPSVAERFLARWHCFIEQVKRALEMGVDPFRESVFVGSNDFVEERADLLADEQRYRFDVRRGEQWRIRLPGAKRMESALLLRKPTSFQFPFWSRRDRATPTGDPYVFLAVDWGAGEWIFSTDPALGISLAGLAQTLQAAEEQAVGSPSQSVGQWYDGERHQHTIVAVPRGGTRLLPVQVLKLVKRWLNARKFAARSALIHQTPLLVAGAALVGLLLVAVFGGRWWNREEQSGRELYRQVAATVVRIDTPRERGSGFVISSAGWIVTNWHVIHSARPDPRTGAQQASIYIGQLTDGHVRRSDTPFVADVFKVDPQRDLALLKVRDRPEQSPAFLAAELLDAGADEITPGLNCWAIGNPDLPLDPFNLMRPGVVGRIDESTTLNESNQGLPIQVIHSSCPLSAGDSGSPLFEAAGRVIGVTVAIPRRGSDTVHVHVNELHAFLTGCEQLPSTPPLYVPSDRPASRWRRGLDLDNDGELETVVFTDLDDALETVKITGYSVDLQHANRATTSQDFADPQVDPIHRNTWKQNFVLLREPWLTAFYDTDGDQLWDEIYQSPDKQGERPAADLRWQREGSQWQLTAVSGDEPLLKASRFSATEMSERFERLARKLEAQLRQSH